MDEHVNLTDLIRRAEQGDGEAADRLFAATYADLCTLARLRLMSGGRNALLDTGSLVHESYLALCHLRLLENRGPCALPALGRTRDAIGDRRFRAAADRHAQGRRCRARGADGRGCRRARDSAEEILAVHEALDDLTAVDPRLGQIIELRYFGGLTEAEIAQALGVTERTVRRDWQKGQLLLRAVLE